MSSFIRKVYSYVVVWCIKGGITVSFNLSDQTQLWVLLCAALVLTWNFSVGGWQVFLGLRNPEVKIFTWEI
jgi:hypothetical protein